MFAALALALAPVSLPVDGWVAFEQPAVPGVHRMGCGADETLSLSRRVEHWGEQVEDNLDAHETFTVFVHMQDGTPDAVRAVTPDCTVVEAADVPTARVSGEQGVRLFGEWIDDSRRRSLDSELIAALAHVAHDDADTVLEALAENVASESDSSDALFWLAQRRGAKGRTIVTRHLEAEWPMAHRRHAVMVLALSGHTDALEVVRSVARESDERRLRAQAVTALGIVKAPGALADLHSLFLSDDDGDVREQAIFAMAQLESIEAARVLVGIAKRPEFEQHRRSALFWLANMRSQESERLMDELLVELL